MNWRRFSTSEVRLRCVPALGVVGEHRRTLGVRVDAVTDRYASIKVEYSVNSQSTGKFEETCTDRVRTLQLSRPPTRDQFGSKPRNGHSETTDLTAVFSAARTPSSPVAMRRRHRVQPRRPSWCSTRTTCLGAASPRRRRQEDCPRVRRCRSEPSLLMSASIVT